MTCEMIIDGPQGGSRRRIGAFDRGLKLSLATLGIVIMGLGVPLALLPGHLGLPLLLLGLMLTLRNSMGARRQFVRWQRRHPNILFPLRRLLRRKPEIAPVFWHQSMKLERLIVPRRWRRMGRWRRALMRKFARRKPAVV